MFMLYVYVEREALKILYVAVAVWPLRLPTPWVAEIFQLSLLIPDVDIVLNNVRATLLALADAVISQMAVSAVV